MQKSLPSRIPFYFAARSQSRHATFTVGSGAHHAAAAVRSVSQEREAEQAEDLHAHDLLPAALRQLEQDLDLYNNIGRLVTFNKLIRDWVPWNRHVSVLRIR
jgi:ribosomal protein S12 methylthiotransferase accessory factor YcaO